MKTIFHKLHLRKAAVALLLILMISTMVNALSLWPSQRKSPYSASRTLKEGDILTVLIEETAQAAQSAGTNTSKKTGLDATLTTEWSRQGANTNQDSSRLRGGLQGESDYAGKGETTRHSLVRATVSVSVKKVLPNGNLLISGERHVNVNEENETIMVSGIIRPEDLAADNTVYSSQLSEAHISMKGNGTVGSKQSPGFFSRMLEWFF